MTSMLTHSTQRYLGDSREVSHLFIHSSIHSPTQRASASSPPSFIMHLPTLLFAAFLTATSASATLTTDQQAALDAHNTARAAVGTDPLTWSTSLLADAQAWADHLAEAGVLEHDDSLETEGENLYGPGSGSGQLTAATEAFLAEKDLYDGEAITATNYMTFGHYSKTLRIFVHEVQVQRRRMRWLMWHV